MTQNTDFHRLAEIQKALAVPKEHENDFGKYLYRNAEDILSAVKELLKEGEFILTDVHIEQIGDRYYVVVTASFYNGVYKPISVRAFARESMDKKGMDDSQITGAATSYAKKYALCGLFAIDNEKDADSMNNTKAVKNNNIQDNKPKPKSHEEQIVELKKKINEKQTVAELESSKQKLIDSTFFKELSDNAKEDIVLYIANKKIQLESKQCPF